MKRDTRIVKAGRSPLDHHGVVNPPVYHASTILKGSLESFRDGDKTPLEGVYYGHFGTPTTFAFEDAVAALEGYDRCVAVPTGIGAIAVPLLALLSAGDHVLVPDNSYGPTRRFCNNYLARFGIETTYYDQSIGGGIAALMTPKTRMVVLEAPGSLTFEVPDSPAIIAAAHAHGAKVMMDNTWSGGVYFAAKGFGVDISVQAATKYLSGHSDVMMGTICMDAALHRKIKRTQIDFGYSVAPDDCYLAQRGLRTLGIRLERHQESALTVAGWLRTRPEVKRLLHPAFADCPGHDYWKRDFTGSTGLFAVVLHDTRQEAVDALVDALEFFGIGESWGGFESLVSHPNPRKVRTAVPWTEAGQVVRFYVGLEDPLDLIADLEKGFNQMAAIG
ncbi:MAG: cystathionine beta-lyase [Magnetospiraceae bacterium]